MVQSFRPHGASWWCTLCGTWSAPPGSSQTEKLIGHISFHPDFWLWKEELSAQAHRQTVEEIIPGSRRWNRVRSFLTSLDIIRYMWLQNRATKGSKVAGSPLNRPGEQLELEEDDFESNGDKNFVQVERKCSPPHGSSTLNLLISSTSRISQLKERCQRHPWLPCFAFFVVIFGARYAGANTWFSLYDYISEGRFCFQIFWLQIVLMGENWQKLWLYIQE